MKRIVLWFYKASLFIGKTILISLLLISLNILLLYLIEITGLYATTPNALSKPYESYFKNMSRILPFFTIYVGWVPFLTIILFHWIVRYSTMNRFWEYVTGISIVLFLFLCYAMLIEGLERNLEFFHQGLFIYPVLGFLMVLLHNLFWSTKTSKEY